MVKKNKKDLKNEENSTDISQDSLQVNKSTNSLKEVVHSTNKKDSLNYSKTKLKQTKNNKRKREDTLKLELPETGKKICLNESNNISVANSKVKEKVQAESNNESKKKKSGKKNKSKTLPSIIKPDTNYLIDEAKKKLEDGEKLELYDAKESEDEGAEELVDDDAEELEDNDAEELEDDDAEELEYDDAEELEDEAEEFEDEAEEFEDEADELEADADTEELEDEADAEELEDEADAEELEDDANAEELEDDANAEEFEDEASAEELEDDADAEELEDDANAEELDDDDEELEDIDEDELKIWDEEDDEMDDVHENMPKESDSEDEDEDGTAERGIVTKALIRKVSNDFTGKKPIFAIKCSQHLLTAAILSIKGSDDLQLKSPYKLEGPQMFNSVVRMCLTHVAPCLHKLLGMKTVNSKPLKGSKWKKLAITIKRYLHGLITMTKLITDAAVIRLVLNQGILPLLPLFKEFPLTRWSLLKNLITLWSSSEEKVRVLTVIIMFRLMKGLDDEHYDKTMKTLYMSYVKNCQFTSPSTWPSIHFMRVSLTELYSLNPNIAYSHAFIYIRQLTLHLRNAMEVESQERIRLIASWQYLHCLHLWAELLGKPSNNSILTPLIHPLVQICIGSMKLLKNSQYYPYIFHVSNILSDLSRSTKTYIPVGDHLLQVLEDRCLLKKANKSSMKPFDWSCIFKVAPSQMNESAFQDGLIEEMYNCLVNFVDCQSHYISFPEIVMLITKKLKDFCNKCKVSTYSKKMKKLSVKIEENINFIERRRKNVDFSIKEKKAIETWEIETLQASPPIRALYTERTNKIQGK